MPVSGVDLTAPYCADRTRGGAGADRQRWPHLQILSAETTNNRRGADALLRSVVVVPNVRGRGWGRAIASRTLDQAQNLGVTRVYLLTTTAKTFISRLDFSAIERRDAPRAITSTEEGILDSLPGVGDVHGAGLPVKGRR